MASTIPIELFDYPEKIAYHDCGLSKAFDITNNITHDRERKPHKREEYYDLITRFNMLLNEKTIKLATNRFYTNMAYDPYNKEMVICFMPLVIACKMVFEVEIWHQIDNQWTLKKTKRIIGKYEYSSALPTEKINNIIFTKHYYIIHLKVQFTNGVSLFPHDHLYVIDKKLLYHRVFIWGSDPVYLDEYDVWIEKRLSMLKDIKALKKICEDVLLIILSYVD